MSFYPFYIIFIMTTTYKMLFTLLCCVLLMTMQASTTDNGLVKAITWKPGERLSEETVRHAGINQLFAIEAVSDDTFQRMYGKSYKKNCSIPRSSLRYLKVVHRNLKGETIMGELVCNKKIANDLIAIFKALYEASYPIERMVLIDDYGADDDLSMRHNNTSCFNYRTVAGSKVLSCHSKGMAIDINPLYNPCVKKNAQGKVTVQPETGRKYTDRNKNFDCKIDTNDLCYKLFVQHGFVWGGSWKRVKDYQHFEKPE